MLVRVRPVHPHACGEIAPVDLAAPNDDGSPPRVWGNRVRRGQDRQSYRFTPTRVGKSGRSVSCQSCRAVHPHACGEIAVSGFADPRTTGSPPRVWGNRIASTASARGSRFTPTRVGKSPPLGGRLRLVAVHPHACGEIYTARIARNVHTGSPPRVWGNPPDRRRVLQALRFTPTRVGKSSPAASPPASAAVHPHACGEITASARIARCTSGSPPRVWGNLLAALGGGGLLRFTPTRVGKSSAAAT